MRRLVFLAFFLLSSPALAQMIAPLTTPDDHIACTQGMTGIGRTAQWEAIADPQAYNGWALAETRGDRTELHFPLCIDQQVVATDIDAALQFKPVSGTAARTAGIVLRAQNANDYYVVTANALDGSVRLYRMQGGRRAQIAVKQTPISTGAWHELHVILIRNAFQIFLDGKEALKASDDSLPLAGNVGVWSQSDSLIHFGRLLVGPPTL